MLFEILTEDVSAGFIENDILRTLQDMSEMCQQAVIDGGAWPTEAEIRSAYGSATGGSGCFHWTEAEAVANSDDMLKLIFAYTSTYAVGGKLDLPVVTSLRSTDIWIHIVSELGFRNSDNPFITYVLKYKNFDTSIMRSQLIVLNNIFSEEIINKEPLEDSTSILYNPLVWTISMDDATKLLDNYFFVKGHRSRYNKDIAASTAKERTIKARVDAHLEKMENYLVFAENSEQASLGKKMEPAHIVAEFVNKFFKRSALDSVRRRSSDDEEDAAAPRGSLDASRKSAIDKMLADGGFRYSDVASIVAYIKGLHDSGALR